MKKIINLIEDLKNSQEGQESPRIVAVLEILALHVNALASKKK